jgi:hypothetical protein
MKDSMRVRGIITARLFGPDGRLKQEVVTENIITNAGRQMIIDRLQGNTPAVADYIAIGTSATAAAAADTTLVAEVARAQATLSQPDAHTDRAVYTFGAGVGTGTIQEAGRLNAAAAGTLLARGILGASVTKTASDSLQMTYDVTYAAS